MIPFGDHISATSLSFDKDGEGVTFYGGAIVYKKAGTGLVTRLHSANTRMQVENNAGSILGTYWDSGNLPLTWSGSALGVPGTVEMRGHSLGDGVNVGSIGDTSWLLIAQHTSTGMGISKKFEVDLMGGDFADLTVYKLVFDSFNTDGSKATYQFRRVWSGWTNGETELFQKIEIKVFRETSSGIFQVFIRGAAVSYFQLTAVVRTADGSTVDSYYPTVQALPTTGWTEIGVSAGELPVRILLDSCQMRNTSLARDAVYTYADLAEVATWDFDGTNITASHKVRLSASTTARSSLNVPQGVAPTTPGNGDVWQDGSYFYFRNATGTRYFVSTAGFSTNSIPKASSTGILVDSLLTDTGTEIRQSSGLHRFYNPNLTDFVIAFTRGTAGAPDANSAFVMRMDGYQEWGAGGGSARDTNLYRSAANTLKTDDVFEANALRGTANSTPTTSANSIWSTAPIVANRSSTSGTTTVAGIGFHNQGVNAALLYYDPAASKFMYNRHVGGPLLTLLDTESLSAADANLGSTYEGASDPFHATQRYAAFDKRGGVRTWHGIGPFSGTEDWYNVVDVTHRNGGGDGAAGYGGILAWGMTNFTTRMAFASRSSSGTYSWTEVWTKAEISDSNMPRLNGNNAWTGENTFFGDLKIRSNGFDQRSGSGGAGTGSGGLFAKEQTTTTEPYNGVAFWYSDSQSRSSLGVHANPAAQPNDGIFIESNNDSSNPIVRIRGADVEIRANSGGQLGVRRVSRLSLNEGVDSVTSSNVTMSKIRAIIDSTTARDVTLPSPSEHDVVVMMVRTDATTGAHRAYPPTGALIYWTGHDGTSRIGNPSGAPTGTPPRLRLGMYWFASDGADWYLLSPASAS